MVVDDIWLFVGKVSRFCTHEHIMFHSLLLYVEGLYKFL